MSRRYNAADYHPGLNPSLPKTNRPWRIWAIMLLLAAVLGFGWNWLAPDIWLSRPELSFVTGNVTATSVATNRTMQPITLRVRFAIGRANMAGKSHAGSFREYAFKEVVAKIQPGTKTPISCEFPKTDVALNYAEARIVSTSEANLR